MSGPHAVIDPKRVGERTQKFNSLEVGKRYRVCATFVDFDGDAHAPGEEWIFLGSTFLPYEDGLSLFVSLDGSREWQIRMQWRPESQGAILDGFADYVVLP
jgi:hypothetical protein